MKNLEALRMREGLSREDVSRRLGVSAMTIRNWEHGETEPAASHIRALAELFGVTTDYLLGGETLDV